MQVRSFQLSDLPELSQIDKNCFPPGIAYTRKELAEYIQNRFSMTWVAEANGAIVGFVVVNRQPSSVAHIITIDVIERWRGRGVGAALMEAAEKWVRQAKLDLIRLETAETNVQAQKFYEKRGYKRVEKIERYYSRNLAAWVMEKQLNSTQK